MAGNLKTIQNVAHKAPSPWWVGIVCGMASFIDSCAIVSSGTALVIYQKSLGLTNSQFGVLSASLTFTIAIGALFGGRLGDRFGRKHVFSVTMGIIVLGSILLVLSSSFWSLLCGMALVGIGTGADLPVSLATISESANDSNRGKIIGLSNVLWQVGIIAAAAVASIVGDWGRQGGQILFGFVGVVALVVFLLRLSIPESDLWVTARAERKKGIETVRAERSSFRDLLRVPYVKPFIALIVFYALVNVGANTGGQFGTWVNVNIIHMSVATSSRITLIMYPINLIFYFLFMRVVDTKKRMMFFYIGAVCFFGAYLIYVVFGFSIVTFIAFSIINNFGGAFAFEGIMKVWAQESFPTLLRTTAQGVIVFAARFVAAIVGSFTASLIAFSPRGAYLGLAVLVFVGYVFAVWGFAKNRRNEFDTEGVEEAAGPAGEPVDAVN